MHYQSLPEKFKTYSLTKTKKFLFKSCAENLSFLFICVSCHITIQTRWNKLQIKFYALYWLLFIYWNLPLVAELFKQDTYQLLLSEPLCQGKFAISRRFVAVWVSLKLMIYVHKSRFLALKGKVKHSKFKHRTLLYSSVL